MKEDIENNWDRVYKNYPSDESVWKNLDPQYNGASPYIIEKIKKLPKSAKILDAGCGDGRNLIPIRKLGYDIQGIDISKEAIMRAKKLLMRKKIKADIKIGSFHQLPYGKNAFDAIIYDLVHVHIEDPDSVLKEFKRVLKTNGLVFLEITSKNDPIFKGINNFYEKGFYFRFYSRQEAKRLVSKYFKVLSIEYVTIPNLGHGKDFAKRKKHFHKSYLVVARKIS